MSTKMAANTVVTVTHADSLQRALIQQAQAGAS